MAGSQVESTVGIAFLPTENKISAKPFAVSRFPVSKRLQFFGCIFTDNLNTAIPTGVVGFYCLEITRSAQEPRRPRVSTDQRKNTTVLQSNPTLKYLILSFLSVLHTPFKIFSFVLLCYCVGWLARVDKLIFTASIPLSAKSCQSFIALH